MIKKEAAIGIVMLSDWRGSKVLRLLDPCRCLCIMNHLVVLRILSVKEAFDFSKESPWLFRSLRLDASYRFGILIVDHNIIVLSDKNMEQ